MAEYIDLNNTEVLAEAGENAKLVVEEDGELKRIPASAVGQVKTVNGVEPDMKGNVKVSGLPEGATANQVLATNAEGAVAWEEKPFYEETARGELVVSLETSTNGYSDAAPANQKKLEDNGVYIVVVSDSERTETFTCVVNNREIGSAPSTFDKYPFFFHSFSFQFDTINEFHWDNTVFKNTPVKIEIYEATVTVHPLDAKFLPEGAGGGEQFIVTFTADNGSSSGFDVDKTETDIRNALGEGKSVIGVYNDGGVDHYFSFLGSYSYNGCIFSRMRYDIAPDVWYIDFLSVGSGTCLKIYTMTLG